MSSNVVALPSGPERRRKNPFAGVGRHRRTPEAWAQMKRERDQAVAAARQMEGVVDSIRRDMQALQAEVKQMRALMGSVGQDTVTIIPPSDPEETQPISRAELFPDGDTMRGLRPVIRVGEIKPPDPASSDAATALIERISSQSEKVQHIDPAKPLPLWDSPMAQGFRVVHRNTA